MPMSIEGELHMNLLNLGCGGDRPQEKHWVNLDTLRTFLKEGTPERTNLDKETNYIEWDLMAHLNDRLPTPFGPWDAIVWQHGPEHFPCHAAARIAQQCLETLAPGAPLIVSAPDVDYFMEVHHKDNRDTAGFLFGEPISEEQYETFFSYALFHKEHIQVLNEQGIAAIVRMAGFPLNRIYHQWPEYCDPTLHTLVRQRLNRLQFSAIICAFKP